MSTGLDPDAVRLLELMQERIDPLVEAIVSRAHVLYADDAADIPIEELSATAEALTRVAIPALLAGRSPTDDELAMAAQLGERRARQGVSLETLLRGIRIGARAGLETIRDLAPESQLDAPSLLMIAAALWDWIDEISVEVADAHRRVELARARSDQQQRATFVHGLVRGTLTAQRIAAGATAFSVDPEAGHVVLRARPGPEHPAEAIEALLQPSTWTAGLVAGIDEDVVAILPSAPTAELPVAAGLAPAAGLGSVPHAFALAGRALHTALAFEVTGVVTLADLALRSAVVADDPVTEVVAARILDPLRERGDFGDELLHTLRVYMRCEQNIDRAAQELFVHPNTVRHRIARFEEFTGASLRRLDDLAVIWWALESQARM